MDRLESMSTLVAAVEAGSLSGAARRLGMPLATVSRKVSELEQHLRTRILNRSSRKLTLTDAGRSYLTACKRILDQVSEAERAASGEYSSPRGDLTVTAPLVFGRLHALPVVAEFLRVYPDIDEDLASHDCVTFEGLSAARTWVFKGGKSEASVAVHSRLVVNTAESAIDAAICGVGITRVLSYPMATAERAGTLVRVLGSYESNATPVNLVCGGQLPLPLKLRAFIDFAAPRLKARLAAALGA